LGCDDGFFLKAGESSDEQSVRESTIKIHAIDAIENFTAAHSEEIEEVLNWPWKKFEAFYEAYIKREAAYRAALERNAYITGILANTNLDDNKNTKRNTLESIDTDYQNSLKSIYNINIEEVDLREDPFFKAMKIPGVDFIPGEEATDPDSTTENSEIDVDQGG
jgi:hypothetical protein